MTFIICIIIVSALSLGLSSQIKRYRAVLYVVAAICAGLAAFYQFPGAPMWFRNTILSAFQRGVLSAAFFTVVMYATLFRNGSWTKKRLMPIRAELSITGCIFALGHNTAMGQIYFRMFLTDPRRLSNSQFVALLISVLLIAMMLPLMITSFHGIHRRMNAKSWKKLQRLAYPFYLLIYVHVMVLMLPYALAGRTQYIPTVTAYSAVFISYGVLRLVKAKRDSAARQARSAGSPSGIRATQGY